MRFRLMLMVGMLVGNALHPEQAISAAKQGYIGVQVSPMGRDLAEAMGLPEGQGELVQAVVAGGAADAAGIRGGDVIWSVGEEAVTQSKTLGSLVSARKPGTSVPITFIRDGETKTVILQTAARPRSAQGNAKPPLETPESRAQAYIQEARSEIAISNQQLANKTLSCTSIGPSGDDLKIAKVDGLMQGLVNSQGKFPPYMQAGLSRAIGSLGLEAGKLRLEMADGYLAAGCLPQADRLYRFVLANFSSPNFNGLRQRAQIGIDDVRSQRR